MGFLDSLQFVGRIFLLVSIFGVIVLSIINSSLYLVSHHDARPLMRNTFGRIFASDNHIKFSLEKLKNPKIDPEFASHIKTMVLLDIIILTFFGWLIFRIMKAVLGEGGWNLLTALVSILIAILILFVAETTYVSITEKQFQVGFQGLYQLTVNGFWGEKLLLNQGSEFDEILKVGLEEELMNTTQTLNITESTALY